MWRKNIPQSTSSSSFGKNLSVPPDPNRASRVRISSPYLSLPESAVLKASPVPLDHLPHPNGSLPFDLTTGGTALSIFAPPPPSDALPEALQEVLGSSSSTIREDDVMMQEAADGLESRLRPTRGRDMVNGAGVSASGKGVKVGAPKSGMTVAVKKKGKSKVEGDVVRPAPPMASSRPFT